MVRKQHMGAPLPFGAALKPDLVVAEAGDYEQSDGIKIVLSGDNLVVLGSMDGMEIAMGVQIIDLLECIQTHTRQCES